MSIVATQSRSTQSGTPCLGVNAAFLQEIKDDHSFLNELLQATRDVLHRVDVSRLRARALVELLRRLRDRLAMHFALEEAFGYCEGAVHFPSDWSHEADAYRNQHAMLYLDVCDMVDAAEKLLYNESADSTPRSLQRIAMAFTCFYRRLQMHEAGEEELIDAVMNWQLQRMASPG